MLDIYSHHPEFYKDLIERIWILRNPGDEIELLTPPNQYINLIIPIGGSKYIRNSITYDKPLIEGLSLQPVNITCKNNQTFIGIRFYPYGLYPFIETHNIVNGVSGVPNDLVDKLTVVSKRNSEIDIVDGIFNIMDSIYDKTRYKKTEILREYYNVFRNGGSEMQIDEFCNLNLTNYSTLSRIFNKVVGISPKKFERLIKFRKSLCKLIDTNENLTTVGNESGYFDQPHFIREFKLFLNYTPSQYQDLIHSADKYSKIVNYNFRLF